MALPQPTGPHLVSFTDILDKCGMDGTSFRIYYPTRRYNSNVNFPTWITEDYFHQLEHHMKGVIRSQMPIPINQPFIMPDGIDKLPIVVFSHGLLLSKDTYSFVCSDLASYGFIVAAVDHTDGSIPGSFYMEKGSDTEQKLVKKGFERQFVPFDANETGLERLESVEIRAQDLIRVLNSLENLNDGRLSNLYHPTFELTQFKGKINLEKTAVMGHSFGGATALVSVFKDDRFKIAISLDPWMTVFDEKYLTRKVAKPMFIINCISEITKADAIKIRLLDGDVTGTAAERLTLTLLGTSHFTQTDFAFFSDSFLASVNMTAENDAKLSNKLNTELILTLLRKYLEIPGNADITSILSENRSDVTIGTVVDVTENEIFDAKKKIKTLIKNMGDH